MVVVFFRDKGIYVRLSHDGRISGWSLQLFLSLVSWSFYDVVIFEGVSGPINGWIEHFEPRVTKNHLIASNVCDVEF